ncbi:chemotaxis protein CheW [Nodosilinea sp. LEGE 07088]|uniref:chemotaxis protein CheW n=1 Tax=Nodosilinea sp. LEGE 07088 TaxID=2777968 RepID=UPI00187ED914|nr:chemotaxis protein CheW [Nodosilinea sp. LEGE 07088]MBE9136393.1 chemotaxis protein CheW [Nodosilinea sp. LEGE 07088]
MSATPLTTTASTARLQQLLPQLFQSDTQPGDRYLKLDISPDLSALIALADVQESVQLPTHMVTPIPNLPACILGVVNSRNQVLCVVDLAQVLQIPARTVHRQHYSIVVVHLDSTTGATEDANLLALTLHGIQGIIRLQPEEIESPMSEFAAELTPFLRGCVVRDGQSIPVLDVNAIATAPILNSL